MSTAIATIDTNLPVSDGFDQEETGSNGLIRGTMLKFKDNEWLCNKIEFLPAGTKMTAIGVAMAWVKWVDGKAEHRTTEPGMRHPARHELGDLDQDAWPIGLSGKPEDPLKDTRYTYLIDAKTAQTFTYVCDSAGGRRPVTELKQAIMTYRAAHPRACPIVELTRTTMPTKYGPKPRPLLKVTGWHIPAATPAPTIKRDMDDDIPFAPEVRG
jgi:hypothetical protein